MLDLLKQLCTLDGVSGNENAVRDFVLSQISPYCEVKVDVNGNIIAQKQGENHTDKKIMVDAHLDEVGLIITDITSDGFLRFATVGGIMDSVLISRRVKIGGNIGVIGTKPIHLAKGEKDIPAAENMYIDIGVSSKQEAETKVKVGDYAAFLTDFDMMGEHTFTAKAIDDRAGVAVLIKLLQKESKYSFTATFTVGEEVGLRGAKTAAYTVSPDFALCLEATTASDIAGVSDNKTVCKLGDGVAVSFMDNATVYDRKLYELAINSGIKCQTKSMVAGGNNSGAIHLTKSGVRTVALSLPCRYIHSPASVANVNDFYDQLKLAQYMIEKIGSGAAD